MEEMIIIPMEDELVHSDEHSICEDDTCPCHEDEELVSSLLTQMFSY